MVSIVEVLKKQNEWQNIVDQIKNHYTKQEEQNAHIKNLEKVFEEIKIPDDWEVIITGFEFNEPSVPSYISVNLYKKDGEKPLFFFYVALNRGSTFEEEKYKYKIFVRDLTLHFYNPEIRILIDEPDTPDFYKNIDLDKLLEKYDELNSLFQNFYKKELTK
jgi:hypothetical protein